MRADNVVKDAVGALHLARAKNSEGSKEPDGQLPAVDSASQLDGAIALIDFGCPFLNQRYATDEGTRIRALWDQGSDPGSAPEHDPAESWPWRAPQQFKYGRELGPEMLTTLARAASAAGGPEESAVYRGIDYLIDYADPRRRIWLATHGGHLLDGVRFAMSTVARDQPLAVVISYGNGAGPHDGSALIESAFEELLKRRLDNFVIVLAAGNSRTDRGHAQRIVRRDRSVLLRLLLTEGDTTDTFIEAWYAGNDPLQLRVRAPDGVWSEWVGQGEEMLMRSGSADRDVVAMIRHDRWVPNGKRALALLALAPTAQPPGVDCRLAEPGLWEIEYRLATADQKDPVELNAWIERDDPVRGTVAQRTHFIDQTDEDEHNTVSGIATGASTLKAGGYNLGSGRAAPYSALPRKGQTALTVLAACEEDLVQPNVLGAATRSSETYRLNGTSVAAPVLARRLYAVMAAGRVPRQGWPKVLQALTQDSAGLFIKPFSAD